MSKRGIIGAGNWIIDKLKRLDRWPGEGNLGNIIEESHSSGGGPANVLFDLRVIDKEIPLYAAGRLGDDAEGKWLLSEISARNIDSSLMTTSSTAATSFTDVMYADGKRTFFHCRGANAEFTGEELEFADIQAEYFYLGYLLLLDALDSPCDGYATRAVKLLRSIRAKGCKTFVDFVSEAPEKFRKIVLPALPEIDLLVVNEVEASCCSGVELRDAEGKIIWKNLPQAIDFCFSAGVHELVAIHFPEGAIAKTRDGEFSFTPSFLIDPKDIVGSTGAGDAFAAGVLYAVYRGWSLEKALKFGCASSAFNLRSASATAGAVSLTEMEAFLATAQLRDYGEIDFR